MKKLTDTLKQMLNALAYADAGEYLTSREKAEVLSQISDQITKVPVSQSNEAPEITINSTGRRIALYLGSELPAEMMSYVIQTCANMRHDLTVLTFEPENMARSLLQPHDSDLSAAGIDMQLVQLSGDPISGLARYLKGRPEIAFLACKENGYLGRSYLKGTQAGNIMPIPVVVVAAGKGSPESQVVYTTEEKADSANIA